jgi:hypothetical protein
MPKRSISSDRYVDNDKALLQKILVDNPARLHGFAD